MIQIVRNIRAKLLNQNKNFLMIVAGEPGSGKSYGAMRLGQLIDHSFNINKVVFTSKQFMEAIQNAKKGDCIIFDEAGVGVPSRDWYTIQNKMLGYVVQTFRHLNLCIIFTVPNISFIDVQLRNLFNLYLETQTINYKKNTCTMKIFYMRQWPRSEKVSVFHPRRRMDAEYTKKGKIVKVKTITLQLPQDFVAKYEEVKGEYSTTLRNDVLESIAKVEEKAQPKETSKDIVGRMLEKGFKNVDIVKATGLSPQRVSDLRSQINI